MRPLPGIVALACITLVAGSAAAQASPAEPCKSRSLAFDAADAGWRHVSMSWLKRDTAYTLSREDGRTVLTARAEGSASFYVAPLARPMSVPDTLSWSWKTDALVPGADNRDAKREDAPLRVVVAFDGDASKLPAAERVKRKLAVAQSGSAPPYAMLMYIWGDKVAPETIIASAHSGQVKMLVVDSGGHGLGSWRTARRNLAADYRRAFGAEPGPMLSVGALTDTDNTGATALGRYADFRIDCAAD